MKKTIPNIWGVMMDDNEDEIDEITADVITEMARDEYDRQLSKMILDLTTMLEQGLTNSTWDKDNIELRLDLQRHPVVKEHETLLRRRRRRSIKE